MANKPTAIIHIGVEKTGTTTIQEFLFQNKNLLKQQGIWFPKIITARNHRPLAVYCCKPDRSNQFTRQYNIENPKKRKEWRAEFREIFSMEMPKESNEYKKVIFSSEHFTTFLKGKSEIRLLKSFLEPYFASQTILVYIRRQDLVASSMINNAVKSGIGNKLPTGKKIKSKHYYNYENLISKWSEVFGKENIRMRVYEKDRLNGKDLLVDFMDKAEILSDKRFTIPQWLNISLSATAVEAAWLFNKKYPSRNFKDDYSELRNLRLKLINQTNERYPGNGKMLNRRDAKKYFKQFRKSNCRLAKEWFGSKDLFCDDFSMYPKCEEKINPDLIHELVEDFIRREGIQNKFNANG